jgi:PIN domain nuclease of toxin-antitoxin system
MLSLDAHVLLHAVGGRLTRRESRLLRGDRWGISGIVLWEIAKVARLGRIALDLESPQVDKVISSVHVWPISLEIARVSVALDVRADPADELIAATSIVHGAACVNRSSSDSAGVF